MQAAIRSPCAACEKIGPGGDKNCDECRDCTARIAYVNGIDPENLTRGTRNYIVKAESGGGMEHDRTWFDKIRNEVCAQFDIEVAELGTKDKRAVAAKIALAHKLKDAGMIQRQAAKWMGVGYSTFTWYLTKTVPDAADCPAPVSSADKDGPCRPLAKTSPSDISVTIQLTLSVPAQRLDEFMAAVGKFA